MRWLWWLLAYASLGLGVIGIVVLWLLAHRQFGPMIRDWQAGGAVSRRAKCLASIMMSGSAILMLLLMPERRMALPGIVVMAIVAAWLWRRPEPR